ncbi:MAG: 30S ribosomal protein S17 [Chloroflexi bacterium]|nr:30S ribosomal protein S17 [Chloroflexota bacterium]
MQQQLQAKPERKERVAVVVSDKMDKTRVVAVQWFRKHPIYGRAVRRLSKFKAHDEKNEARRGDTVRIVETRPLSKDKRWRIVEIITKAPIVDVAPEEIDSELLATKLKESSPEATAQAPAAQAPAAAPAAPPAEKKPEAKAPKAETEAKPKAKKAAKAEAAEEKAPAKKPAARKKKAEESEK